MYADSQIHNSRSHGSDRVQESHCYPSARTWTEAGSKGVRPALTAQRGETIPGSRRWWRRRRVLGLSASPQGAHHAGFVGQRCKPHRDAAHHLYSNTERGGQKSTFTTQQGPWDTHEEEKLWCSSCLEQKRYVARRRSAEDSFPKGEGPWSNKQTLEHYETAHLPSARYPPCILMTFSLEGSFPHQQRSGEEGTKSKDDAPGWYADGH